MAASLDIIRQKREAINNSLLSENLDIKKTKVEYEMQKAKPSYISSEVRFYGVCDLMEMLGWSKNIVLKLFNDPSFPSTDFGKTKAIEAHALIEYFSVKRSRETDRYWSQREVI